MSTASANNLQAAAGIAAAVAASLAATPNQPMNAASVASILGVVLQAAGTVNPNVGAVIALASIGLQAMHVATTTGAGLTAEQFAQLKAADDAAIAADVAAHPKA